mmetsp:Transcript_99403/g.320416  ORF Transcript_99403/g.320416 Transcript_99403/m.320416 type:complete len:98 (-) Transcript_99403:77-370(-)
MLQRSLKIQEEHCRPEHFSVAITLVNLANANGALGDLHTTLEMLQRALESFQKHYGPDHPHVALVLKNLGSALEALGDREGAEKFRAAARLERPRGR